MNSDETASADGSYPSFRMPDVGYLLPARIHPSAQKIHVDSQDWCREELGFTFTDKREFTEFLDCVTDLWASMCMPDGREEVVRVDADLDYFLLILDDKHAKRIRGSAYGDEGSGFGHDPSLAWAAVEELATIMHGQPPNQDFPYAPVFARIWGRATAGMSSGLRERFADTINEVAGGFAAEVAPRPQGPHPDFDFPGYTHRAKRTYGSYDEYRIMREHTIGGRYNYVLLEHALGIDMTEPLRESEKMAQAEQYILRHHFLYNDLFSYRKELLANQHDNALTVLQETEGLGLQESVDRLERLAKEAEDDFLVSIHEADLLVAS